MCRQLLTWMVLMAATPSQPVARAVRAGAVMSVMLGVILAHTGLVAMLLIQPHTSCQAPHTVTTQLLHARMAFDSRRLAPGS